MKKVMFILHTYSVGGAERRCISIANYLASHGVKVKVVLLDVNKMYDCKRNSDGLEINIGFTDSPKVDIPANENVELVYLLHKNEKPLSEFTCIPFCENIRPPKNAEDFIKITDTKQKESAKKQLKQLEDLYVNRIYQYVRQFPDYKVVSWMTFVNIATASALYSLPNEFAFAECTAPDIEFAKESGFNYLKELFYPRAESAFYQTEEARNFYTYLPDTKAHVIPNPLLQELPKIADTVRNKNIVTFCRIEKPKNLELLIEAFLILHKRFPSYQLHIYGNGSEKEKLQTLVKKNHAELFILFFDFDVKVHEKILDSAMFVSTSDREGISNSMLEAMAIGLPTVCTDCHGGGARAIINDGENGLLIPMGDKHALVDAMTRIITSPSLSASLSESAVKIRETLSVSNIGKRWYDALINE